MPMQTLGVLIVTLGFWISYCGVYGIPVWETLAAILKDPANADKTLKVLKTRASIKLADDIPAYVAENYARNPFVGKTISRDFNRHIADGSTSPGVDFLMPVGTPLPAIWSGVVTNTANRNPLAGNVTSIKRDNGEVYEYLHVSAFKVLNGTRVKAGQVVALSGGKPGDQGAGNSTAPHVHLQYFKGGKNVDPMKQITGDPDNRNREGGGEF